MQIRKSITFLFVTSPLFVFLVVMLIMFGKQGLAAWLISFVAEIVFVIIVLILCWALPRRWVYNINKATKDRIKKETEKAIGRKLTKR